MKTNYTWRQCILKMVNRICIYELVPCLNKAYNDDDFFIASRAEDLQVGWRS